jgi:hypothetical protein
MREEAAMGAYLNTGKEAYLEAARAAVFVDKTGMIRHLNSVVGTENRFVCVTRPRRFGKTYAADMVCAYYGRGADSRGLFEGLEIAGTDPVTVGGEDLAWDHYLGAFDVVRVTVTDFVRRGAPVRDGLDRMGRLVCRDIVRAYPGADYFDRDDLPLVMQDAFEHSGRRFVVVVDEWDAPMRERRADEEGQRAYLDFLRDWLKDRDYVALAYVTGILPIKKYGNDSGPDMFDEHTMADPGALAAYVGFTDGEVRRVCEEHGADYRDMREWYDGYRLLGGGAGAAPLEVYNPLSVASASRKAKFKGYWGESNTFKALAEYVRMDFDGLGAKVALMMGGARVPADIEGYQNDMSSLSSADDVIALLVHLGYLGWDAGAREAFVPNRDVMEVFRRATSDPGWLHREG